MLHLFSITVNTMDSFFKNPESVETTLKLVDAISQTTDDFFFIWDIKEDANRFFGDVQKRYDLKVNKDGVNSMNDMINIIYPADKKIVISEHEAIAKGEKDIMNLNYRWVTRDNERVWINCHGNVIRDKEGNPLVMIGRISEEAMRHLFNPLTGLWNKTKLREDLKERINLNYGYLMIFDVDSLATINLSHGRSYGDELLKEIGEFLENCDGVEKVYHINHADFSVVTSKNTEADVKLIFDKISEHFEDKCTFNASAVPINNEFFPDAGQLIDSMNLTLKKAKENVEDKIEFFSEEDLIEKITEIMLLEEMKESIDNSFRGFEVYYQPQLSAGNYNLCGIEALLRYESPERGMVFPNEFIPVLEKFRFIDVVGLWVLETAVKQCKEWRKAIPELSVSVNFSTIQFEDKLIGEKIIAVLEKYDFPPSALTVEITESVELHNSEQFARVLKLLKDHGIHFSIDDFGTGYSNLGYLKQMNVNEIKIDRIFVSGIEKGTYNYNLISNLIEFAKTNYINVCCEGVESTRELAILEGLYPDLFQGYLFDKPIKASSIERTYINSETDEYKNREEFVKKIYEFKEKMGIIRFDPKDILRENGVGLFVIRMDRTKGHYEMHIDETLEKILEVDRKFTPVECFEHWEKGISKEYMPTVSKYIDEMISNKKVLQFEYEWNGIPIRSSAKYVKDEDGMVVLEGYLRKI